MKKGPIVMSIILSLLTGFTAHAELRIPSSQLEITAATQSGKPVVLAFHSPSCGTCRKQKPAINSLLEREEFKTLTAYTLDFESYSGLRKALRVTQPSTLVLFKEGKEIARSIGESNPQTLEALLKMGI